MGIRQRLSDHWTLVANLDWEDWSAFSENTLTIQSGPAGNPVVAPIDRKWKDTYKFGIGAGHRKGKQRFACGIAYDTSDGKLDQIAQGERVAGEFDSNWIFFLGGTLRWVL